MYNEATINNDQPDNDYQCHHIFPDNARCGSPRMRNEQFCYYHHDSRRPVVRPHERLARRSTFSLFTPTNYDAIQESLGELLIRIAANDIDPAAPASSSTVSRSPPPTCARPRRHSKTRLVTATQTSHNLKSAQGLR